MTSLIKYGESPLSKFFDTPLTSFDSIFQDFFDTSFPSLRKKIGPDFLTKKAFPKIDVKSYKDKTEILADVPGFDKEEVKVAIEEKEGKNVLSISGEKTEKVDKEEDFVYTCKERTSKFYRAWFLKPNHNFDKLTAKMENNTLIITIPHYEEEPVEEDNIKRVRIE